MPLKIVKIALTKTSSRKRHFIPKTAVYVRKRQLSSQTGTTFPKDEKLPKPHTNFLSPNFLVSGSEYRESNKMFPQNFDLRNLRIAQNFLNENYAYHVNFRPSPRKMCRKRMEKYINPKVRMAQVAC